MKISALLNRLLMSRYRTAIFVAFYIGLFALLAALGYYGTQLAHVGRRKDPAHVFATDITYYYLPTVTTSISSGGDGGGGAHAPRLRLQIGLEVATKDIDVLSGYQPPIMDKIAVFISKLTPEQIQREDFAVWLRGQLLDLVNSAGVPFPIDNLYLAQMVIM